MTVPGARFLRTTVLAVAAAAAVTASAVAAGAGPSWFAPFDLLAGRAPRLHGAALQAPQELDVVVVFGRRGERGGLAAIDGATGGLIWTRPTSVRPCACILDVDGDGLDEVAVAVEDTLYVLGGATGRLEAALRLRDDVGELVSGDVDGDGSVEILYTAGETRNDLLAALDVLSGNEEMVVDARPGEGRFATGFSMPVSVSINGDSRILVVENSVDLLCLSSSGDRVWEARLGTPGRLTPRGVVTARPIVADLLGDDVEDVAVGCFAGSVVVLDGTNGDEILRRVFGAESHRGLFGRRGVPMSVRSALEGTGEPISELLAVELDGVPGLELVFGCSDGFVYALTARRAEVLWSHEGVGDVYDACVDLAPAPAPGGRAGPTRLLAWSDRSVFLMDGSDGSGRPWGASSGGACSAIVGDTDGDGLFEVVLAEPGGMVRRVPVSGLLSP